ncbi:hypothetical protein EXIGLDRAFT_722790 [Exidia glandulosa HHB12029]|uniref:Uncharacterized protein n=1 Tax=Exidia glandulosa HHB12029 TaxID=1314781 RepID=A0A165F3Y8_EXIGL|nr:hypothetical protein EXIGLDRAFT_722790 [Exidia glandulosa HHB12029]
MLVVPIAEFATWARFALWLCTFPASTYLAYKLKTYLDRWLYWLIDANLHLEQQTEPKDLDHDARMSKGPPALVLPAPAITTQPASVVLRRRWQIALAIWSGALLPLNIAMSLALHYYHCTWIYETYPSIYTFEVAARIGFEFFWLSLWPIITTANVFWDTALSGEKMTTFRDHVQLRLSIFNGALLAAVILPWSFFGHLRADAPGWYLSSLLALLYQSLGWLCFWVNQLISCR